MRQTAKVLITHPLKFGAVLTRTRVFTVVFTVVSRSTLECATPCVIDKNPALPRVSASPIVTPSPEV